MPHPLVDQLRFARSEFRRALVGVTDEEARRRFLPMNCISWNVGHLAWQEQRYWLWRAQGLVPRPDVRKAYAYGAAGSAPPLAEVIDAWDQITRAADGWLDGLTTEMLASIEPIGERDRRPKGITYGSLLLRTTYHYWYHTGESMAIRQVLGQTGLPDFVGDLDGKAPYRPE